MRAIVVNEFGGPEVFSRVEVDRPAPEPTQVLVEVTVSGVNFLDVYQRTGASPLQPGFRAGVEGVGVVVEVGSAVTDLRVGQRVGWLTGGQGSFADFAAVQADKAVPIPDEVDDETAAAVLMQGVTAHYLATDTYPIQPGDPVLVHAAAGGVGLLMTQIAKLRGRTDDLFAWLAKGELRVHIGGRFPLSQVSEAFTALESRQTTGKLLLVR